MQVASALHSHLSLQPVRMISRAIINDDHHGIETNTNTAPTPHYDYHWILEYFEHCTSAYFVKMISARFTWFWPKKKNKVDLICPTVSWMKELMAESFSLLLPSQMVTMWNLQQKRLFVNINASNCFYHKELTLLLDCKNSASTIFYGSNIR